MCYNPTVSLTTAIIEWTLAIILPILYPKARIKFFSSTLLFLLGLYQFTEFMFCKTNNPDFWMRIGFIAYTLLPAIGLHGVINFFKIKFNYIWLYIIPIIYIAVAATTTTFLINGQCHDIFITARNIFSQINSPLYSIQFAVYTAYYFSFILISCLIGIKAYLKETNPKKQKVYLIFPLGIFLMAFPTYILLMLFPTLNNQFPSILCHFALLLALTIFVGTRWEQEYIEKK